MTRITNEVLEEQIKGLKELLETGFHGVHERQDTTNGKVIANTEHRISSEAKSEQKDKDERKYRTDLKWVLGFIGGGTLTGLLKIFIF